MCPRLPGNFLQKAPIINIVLPLRMSAYAYAYAYVKLWTSHKFLNFYFKFIAVSQIQFRDRFDSDKQSKWLTSIARFSLKSSCVRVTKKRKHVELLWVKINLFNVFFM